jgi:diguanylate cyclase (GGDEF)-like protein
MERHRRHRRPLTLAYVDLDDFKQVNDRLGHAAGDAALRLAADTMRQHLRGTDALGRLGGDEFAVLLPEADAAGAQMVIARLRDRLRERMRKEGLPITFSFGVLTCLKPPPSVDGLVQLADEQMYVAKNSGKNAIQAATYAG